ncbi:MAG TPA: septal ring lytic transglycosylase RlpA family protein [Flavobacterium sp.]
MRKLLFFVLFLIIAGCSASKSTSGKIYKKNAEVSYYADKFNGRKTASGEKFNNNKLTAAHRNLPFGTKLKVTNIANDESVIVEVNDRGPSKKSRELDLSKKAFMSITDNKNHGVLRTTISIIK